MWTKNIKRILKIVLIGFLALVAFVLLFAFVEPYYKGYATQKTLLTEIDEAETITLVEHSSPYDTENRNVKPFNETIYKTVVLKPGDKENLKAVFNYARDDSTSTMMMCIFDPHHRIEFKKSGGTAFVYEVCLKCGEHDLNGSGKRMLPEGWKTRIEDYLASMSLNAKRGKD